MISWLRLPLCIWLHYGAISALVWRTTLITPYTIKSVGPWVPGGLVSVSYVAIGDFVLKNDIQLLTPSFGCTIAKLIEYFINGSTCATNGQLKPVGYLEPISIALLTAAIADLNPFLRTQTDCWDSPGLKQTNDFNYKYLSPTLTIPANIPLINLPVSQRFFKASEDISSFAAAPTDVTPAEFIGGLSQKFGISIPTSKIPQDANAWEKALARTWLSGLESSYFSQKVRSWWILLRLHFPRRSTRWFRPVVLRPVARWYIWCIRQQKPSNLWQLRRAAR